MGHLSLGYSLVLQEYRVEMVLEENFSLSARVHMDDPVASDGNWHILKIRSVINP